MARELFPRDAMQNAQARTDYVGALLPEEQRLMLVEVSPDEPWEAFRQLRRVMRKQNAKARETAAVAMFSAEGPIQHQAEVISLESRRRAG